ARGYAFFRELDWPAALPRNEDFCRGSPAPPISGRKRSREQAGERQSKSKELTVERPPHLPVVVAESWEIGERRRFTEPSDQCKIASMRKPYITAVTLLTTGIMLVGNAMAQQNPASNPQPAPAAKAPAAPAAKAQTATTA